MGFFGFLKRDSPKKEATSLEAPSMPKADAPSNSSFADLPLSDGPRLAPPQPGPSSMMGEHPPDLLDEFPLPPGGMALPDEDFAPQAPTLEEHDDSPAFPDLPQSPSFDEEIDDADHDGLSAKPPISEMTDHLQKTPLEMGFSQQSKKAETMTSLPPAAPTLPKAVALDDSDDSDDLPDFSAADIEAAEELLKPKSRGADSLPSFDEGEEMLSPQFLNEPLRYVPATQYREALDTLKRMKGDLRKGDASLKRLTSSVLANKTQFAAIAAMINEMQENLINMDNTLMR